MSAAGWAAFGKAFENIGTTTAGLMLKDISDQKRLDEELRREERYMDRLQAQEDHKVSLAERLAEEKKQKVLADVAASIKQADEIGVKRTSKELTGLDQPSEETLETVRNMPAEARKAYEKSGLLSTAKHPELQRADDLYQGSLEAGAGKEVTDAYAKAKSQVLAEIEVNRRAAKDKEDADLKLRAEDRRDRALAQALSRSGDDETTLTRNMKRIMKETGWTAEETLRYLNQAKTPGESYSQKEKTDPNTGQKSTETTRRGSGKPPETPEALSAPPAGKPWLRYQSK